MHVVTMKGDNRKISLINELLLSCYAHVRCHLVALNLSLFYIGNGINPYLSIFILIKFVQSFSMYVIVDYKICVALSREESRGIRSGEGITYSKGLTIGCE